MVILKTIVGNLSANVNEITFTDNIIDGNSIIEVYYNSNDIYTVETWQREHTVGIVTSDHDFPVSVKVLINNVVAFEPYDDTEVLSQLSDLDNRVYHAEDAISELTDRVGTAENDIDALETAMNGKQDVLIAGTGITIEDNVISSNASISYSTTERIIGKWVDGRDIYQKVIDFGVDLSFTSTSWFDTNVRIGNVSILECRGMYSGGSFYNYNAYQNNGVLNLMGLRNTGDNYVKYLIIEYVYNS